MSIDSWFSKEQKEREKAIKRFKVNLNPDRVMALGYLPPIPRRDAMLSDPDLKRKVREFHDAARSNPKVFNYLAQTLHGEEAAKDYLDTMKFALSDKGRKGEGFGVNVPVRISKNIADNVDISMDADIQARTSGVKADNFRVGANIKFGGPKGKGTRAIKKKGEEYDRLWKEYEWAVRLYRKTGDKQYLEFEEETLKKIDKFDRENFHRKEDPKAYPEDIKKRIPYEEGIKGMPNARFDEPDEPKQPKEPPGWSKHIKPMFSDDPGIKAEVNLGFGGKGKPTFSGDVKPMGAGAAIGGMAGGVLFGPVGASVGGLLGAGAELVTKMPIFTGPVRKDKEGWTLFANLDAQDKQWYESRSRDELEWILEKGREQSAKGKNPKKYRDQIGRVEKAAKRAMAIIDMNNERTLDPSGWIPGDIFAKSDELVDPNPDQQPTTNLAPFSVVDSAWKTRDQKIEDAKRKALQGDIAKSAQDFKQSWAGVMPPKTHKDNFDVSWMSEPLNDGATPQPEPEKKVAPPSIAPTPIKKAVAPPQVPNPTWTPQPSWSYLASGSNMKKYRPLNADARRILKENFGKEFTTQGQADTLLSNLLYGKTY